MNPDKAVLLILRDVQKNLVNHNPLYTVYYLGHGEAVASIPASDSARNKNLIEGALKKLILRMDPDWVCKISEIENKVLFILFTRSKEIFTGRASITQERTLNPIEWGEKTFTLLSLAEAIA